VAINSETVEYTKIQCRICINIFVYRCIGWSQCPLACLDCGFEYRRRHGYLFVVSLCVRLCSVRRGVSYRTRCVAVCVLEISWMRRPWPELGRSATITKNMSLFDKSSFWYVNRFHFDCRYNWILLLSVQKSWHLLEWRCLGLNLLKPTGHLMKNQFKVQQLYVLPTLCLCVLYLSDKKQRLVPLTA